MTKTRFPLLLLAAALSCSGRQAPSGQVGQSSDIVGSFAQFASAEVRSAALTYPDAALEIEPPLSLTTNDGTGLELTQLKGRAVVDGPLAFTELHLSFRNPEDRILEGRFSITLPEGAAISRMAMRIEGQWQEAEMVERQLAHRAYEDFLHRKQDPALLEKEAGNQFRARIFPIPARGVKELIVSYSHELPGADDAYELPLAGLPEIAELDISALVASPTGFRTVSMTKKRFKPTDNFVARPTTTIAGVRSGKLAVVRVRPSLSSERQTIKSLAILFDTSASRAPGFVKSIDKLSALIKQLVKTHGSDFQLTVAAFDQETMPIFAGRAGDFGARQITTLRARRPLGASDLGAALDWVATRQKISRLVVMTDGIATAGSSDDDELQLTMRKLASVERVDMVLSGGIRDTALARGLVRGTRDRDGAVLDGDTDAVALADRLGRATASGISVSVPGARWVWPETLDGVQAGDEVLVYATMEKPTGSSVKVVLGGSHTQTIEAALRPVAGALLARSAAGAEIARLTARRAKRTGPEGAKMRAHLKNQIVEVSTRHRVLSDFTALLVLETDNDYARFGIDRKALADILTVGPQGVQRLQRQSALTIAKTPETRPATKELSKKTGVKDKAESTTTGRAAPDSKAEPAPSQPMDSVNGTGSLQGDAIAEAAPARVVDTRPARQGVTIPESEVRRERRPAPSPEPDNDADGIVDDQDRGDGDDDDDDSEPGESEFEKNVKNSPPAYTGRMATVMGMLAEQKVDAAIVSALGWRNEEPGDVMALIALGEALELANNHRLAARAYGSIIDLFPSRADLRRFAGARLQRLRGSASLAADSFAKALEQRPDHLSVYRLLAFALVRANKHGEAFDVLERGLARTFPSGRFAGGLRILAEDLRLVGAAWSATAPNKAAEIVTRLAKHNLQPADKPSLRFVLNWETDANDVDFHVYDAKGGHAYYSQKTLPSGGELYADVTTGYGPECFTIEGEPTAYPYKMQIHYYSRGPMGYGMGQVEVVHHDGKGGLRFQQRPFVVMSDSAYLDLGTVTPN